MGEFPCGEKAPKILGIIFPFIRDLIERKGLWSWCASNFYVRMCGWAPHNCGETLGESSFGPRIVWPNDPPEGRPLLELTVPLGLVIPRKG